MEQASSGLPEARSPGSLEKAIEILQHLHAEPAAAGVTAIGRALDMPKSSVHRLLAALVHHGLVERDARGRYRPGMGLVALGLGALEREPVVAARYGAAHRMGRRQFENCARPQIGRSQV